MVVAKLGMCTSFKETTVFDAESFYNFDLDSIDVHDIVKLDNHFLIQTNIDEMSTMLDNGTETHNVNIGIASAITANARVVMSHFKNNKALKLYYTDTDSIYTNLKPNEMNELYPSQRQIVDNKELGKLKLETISIKAIFISPKVYYLKTIEDEEIYKVKGLQKQIQLSEDDFENLLFKDITLIKSQEKWFKSLSTGRIDVKSLDFSLKQTDNKRELQFNSNGKLISTKPYHINEDGSIIYPPPPPLLAFDHKESILACGYKIR